MHYALVQDPNVNSVTSMIAVKECKYSVINKYAPYNTGIIGASEIVVGKVYIPYVSHCRTLLL